MSSRIPSTEEAVVPLRRRPAGSWRPSQPGSGWRQAGRNIRRFVLTVAATGLAVALLYVLLAPFRHPQTQLVTFSQPLAADLSDDQLASARPPQFVAEDLATFDALRAVLVNDDGTGAPRHEVLLSTPLPSAAARARLLAAAADIERQRMADWQASPIRTDLPAPAPLTAAERSLLEEQAELEQRVAQLSGTAGGQARPSTTAGVPVDEAVQQFRSRGAALERIWQQLPTEARSDPAASAGARDEESTRTQQAFRALRLIDPRDVPLNARAAARRPPPGTAPAHPQLLAEAAPRASRRPAVRPAR